MIIVANWDKTGAAPYSEGMGTDRTVKGFDWARLFNSMKSTMPMPFKAAKAASQKYINYGYYLSVYKCISQYL